MAKLDFITGGDNFITSNGLQYRVEGERAYTVDSFDVLLYHSNADHNQVDKTPDLTSARAYKGTLRRGTSLINPVITIQHPTTWFWNYMYIPEFQRYYFITDIVSVNLFLWEIHTHVDVLMTYKAGIADLTTRVLRSDSEANWQITDSLVPANSWARMGSYRATPIDGTIWSYYENLSINAYRHYLVKIAVTNVEWTSRPFRGQPPQNGYIWASMGPDTLAELCLDIRLMGQFADDFKLSDVILDVKYLPINAFLGGLHPQRLIFTEMNLGYTNNYIDTYSYPDTFRAADGVLGLPRTATWKVNLPVQNVLYRNNPPYKTMAVKFEPFGQIAIDTQRWGNKSTLYFRVLCDVITGNAILEVSDNKNFAYSEKLGEANIAIPIDITTVLPQERQQTQTLIGGLGSIANGVIASVASGNPLPAITSAIGGIGKMITGVNPPPLYNSCAGSGTADYLGDGAPVVLVSRLEQDNPNVGRIAIVDGREKVIAGTQGWLLNKDRKLSTLWGYTVVAGGVHIEGVGFRNCTTQERDELEQLLTSGVILPKQI